MKYQTIQVGGFEVNCTFLSEGDKAWLVDPGQEADRILALLETKNLALAGVLLTHAHFDHIGALPALTARHPKLPIYIHPNDRKVVSHPQNQLPPEYPHFDSDTFVFRDVREFKDFEVRVIETPGHTPGGVCYYLKAAGLLLSGDTLFAGSVGRTDLPGGDMATLMASIEMLKELPDDTTVIPGHGPFTTIGAEKRGNPFLN